MTWIRYSRGILWNKYDSQARHIKQEFLKKFGDDIIEKYIQVNNMNIKDIFINLFDDNDVKDKIKSHIEDKKINVVHNIISILDAFINKNFLNISEDYISNNYDVHHIIPKGMCGPSSPVNYIILHKYNHTKLHMSEEYMKLDPEDGRDYVLTVLTPVLYGLRKVCEEQSCMLDDKSLLIIQNIINILFKSLGIVVGEVSANGAVGDNIHGMTDNKETGVEAAKDHIICRREKQQGLAKELNNIIQYLRENVQPKQVIAFDEVNFYIIATDMNKIGYNNTPTILACESECSRYTLSVAKDE